jgi:hypothetical protein
MNAVTTVNVDPVPRGAWEVRLPGGTEHMLCPSLEEAVRIAQRCAADREGCELVVHDAYHRVLHRELVAARDTQS